MKRETLNEIRRMQKIAGLLKEDDKDISMSSISESTPSAEELMEQPGYVVILSDEYYEYEMVGLADFNGKCYMVEDLQSDTNPDGNPIVVELKQGLTTQKVIEMGTKQGFFNPAEIEKPKTIYLNLEKEGQVGGWLDSLKA